MFSFNMILTLLYQVIDLYLTKLRSLEVNIKDNEKWKLWFCSKELYLRWNLIKHLSYYIEIVLPSKLKNVHSVLICSFLLPNLFSNFNQSLHSKFFDFIYKNFFESLPNKMSTILNQVWYGNPVRVVVKVKDSFFIFCPSVKKQLSSRLRW